MGRWTYDKQDRNDNGYGDIRIEDVRGFNHEQLTYAHNADCDAYEARIAELEAKVAEWEAHWEFEQGALAHEREQYTAELARVKAGPNLIQYDDELAAIYRIEDDRAKYLAMDSLCRRLASEADEMLEQTVELKQQLARVKAESLRVVPDGEACERRHCGSDTFLHDGNVYFDAGDKYRPKRLSDGAPIMVEWHTIVQPVLLKRLEDVG